MFVGWEEFVVPMLFEGFAVQCFLLCFLSLLLTACLQSKPSDLVSLLLALLALIT